MDADDYVDCPDCGEDIPLLDDDFWDLAGSTIRCPHCGADVTLELGGQTDPGFYLTPVLE